jgi:hypothetical protein
LLLVGSSVAIRLLDARPETSWWLGVPASAVVMGLGLVVFPLVLVGFGFAASHDGTSTGRDRCGRGGAGARGKER